MPAFRPLAISSLLTAAGYEEAFDPQDADIATV